MVNTRSLSAISPAHHVRAGRLLARILLKTVAAAAGDPSFVLVDLARPSDAHLQLVFVGVMTGD